MFKHSRKSIRLKKYDYSSGGAYFVTICISEKKNLFGEIKDGEMILSELGFKAKEFWQYIPYHNENYALDEFIIMPDHIHGILLSSNDFIEVNEKNKGVLSNAPTINISTNEFYSKISPLKNSLGSVIRSFKSSFTLWCSRNGYSNFKWQRNFFERVIRNEKELEKIRQYIHYNPLKYEYEKESESDLKFLS